MAVLLVSALAACGGTAPAASPGSPPASAKAQTPASPSGPLKSSKDTMTIVFTANQGTLDPHFAATTQELLVTRNIYNSLLKYKPNTTEITGDLAEKWDESGDGLTYTFQLRKDVDWHKGFGHFTANDVKASFDRLRSPETKSPFAGSVSMLKEVQVADDYTVKMVLSETYAAFPHLLTNYRAGPIVNVKAVQQFGKDYDWNPVGTGPYMFQSGVPKQEVTIVANDKYFGGPPPIKKIVTKTVPDANAQVVGLESGQFDMIYTARPDPAVTKRLESRGMVQTLFSRNLPDVLLMNVAVKPWDNVKVRQAIAHTLDRQQYVDLARPGIGKPWYSPVPEGYFAATSDVPRYERDINKAKTLLAEAGYPNGLEMLMNVFDVMKLPSDVLAEQMKPAGIKINQEVLDQPTFIGRVVADKGINFAVHCCVRQPDPDIILSDMFSPKYRGAIYISHADLESQLATARKEQDVKKREQMYADIQKKIMSEVLMIPLAMINDVAIHPASLKGMPSVEALWGLDLTRIYFQ